MAFELAPNMGYGDIPIVYVLELGGEEFLGIRDADGGFRQIDSLKKIPIDEWAQVEMFGPSLGLVLPCTASILLDDEPIGLISIRVIEGRPACVSISSHTHGLTGSLLRQIPIASLVRDAATASVVRVLQTEHGAIFGARYVDGGPGFGHLLGDLRAELATVEDRARRRVLGPDFLVQVAATYRAALARNEPPALAVQHALGPTTAENARRWIAAARREGFLGPAPGPGKAGEAQELAASW